MPGYPSTSATPPEIPAAASASQKSGLRRVAPAAAIALALLAGIVWGTGGSEAPEESAAVSSEDVLVVEEQLGFFDKLLGREPRLFITVPAETRLELELLTPLTSETAQPGDEFTASLASSVSIEGIEALPVGTTVTGHVAHAAGAGKVSGVGELTLEFDRLELDDGTAIDINAEPAWFKARTTRRKDAGVVGGLAGVGSVVGGIFGGKKGAVIGGAAGGAAGAGVVASTKGEEMVLGEGASLTTGLTTAITVTREAEDESS